MLFCLAGLYWDGFLVSYEGAYQCKFSGPDDAGKDAESYIGGR